MRRSLFSYLLLFFPVSAEGVQPISWMTRISIAVGVARGLAFLHSLDANVIYRDLKASNILLDSVCYTENLTCVFGVTTSGFLHVSLNSYRVALKNLCRISMRIFPILAWQEMVLPEITLMFQLELLELMVMLLQSM